MSGEPISKLCIDYLVRPGAGILIFSACVSARISWRDSRLLAFLGRVAQPCKELTVIARMKTSILPHFTEALLIPVSLMLAGCGFVQGKKDAEALLTRHFQAVSTNGFDTALDDYSPQFFQKTTKEEWRKALTKLNEKLGVYQSHSVTGWRVFKNATPSGAGTTVLLQCEVTYTKHPATESFTLFKGFGESDYKIVRHQINSTGLLTE
jgi:hypothetical protein